MRNEKSKTSHARLRHHGSHSDGDCLFGEHQKLYVKFLGKIPDTFVISSDSNYKEANADILEFAHVSSCDADIRESRRELKQKNAQGEEVSYNPPRYEYSYEFYIKLVVMGCEYIDDIRFRLSRNTLKLETTQRQSGRGLMFSQSFAPMLYPEYRELKNELDTVCRIFSCGQRGVHYESQTANSGDGIQSLLEQIRNAPDLETAMQMQTALAMMTITNPNSNGYCGTAINTGTIDAIGDAIAGDLTDGDYADAFEGFADKCEYYLDGHLNGFPFNYGMSLVVALLIGVLAGQLTGKSLQGQLKTVRKQHQAKNYVKSGSMNLTEQEDVFLYSDVQRTVKDTDSDDTRSSGGSSRSTGGCSF